MDINLIKQWIDKRRFVSLKEIRQSLGKDAMDRFLASHERIGFFFCPECNYYVRGEEYDALNRICLGCKKQILEVDTTDDAAAYPY